MRSRILLTTGLTALLAVACTNNINAGNLDGGTTTGGAVTTGGSGSAGGTSGSAGSTTGSASSAGTTGSLLGTWDLTTTQFGGSPVTSTVLVAQDQVTVSSPDFHLTFQRAGDTFTLADVESGSNSAVVDGGRTPAAFNAGLVPFDIGGAWTLQLGPGGASPTLGCTLQVSGTEIGAACQGLAPNPGPYFSFTTAKSQSAASSFGDFGGTWLNSWTWGADGGTFPCEIGFNGNQIDTSDGGGVSMGATVSPLQGISFNYDGLNTVSGTVEGWAEFSATRQ